MKRPYFNKEDGKDTAQGIERRLFSPTPDPKSIIYVTLNKEESKITIDFPNGSFSILEEMARKRNLSVPETVAEALRLEVLFHQCKTQKMVAKNFTSQRFNII